MLKSDPWDTPCKILDTELAAKLTQVRGRHIDIVIQDALPPSAKPLPPIWNAKTRKAARDAAGFNE